MEPEESKGDLPIFRGPKPAEYLYKRLCVNTVKDINVFSCLYFIFKNNIRICIILSFVEKVCFSTLSKFRQIGIRPVDLSEDGQLRRPAYSAYSLQQCHSWESFASSSTSLLPNDPLYTLQINTYLLGENRVGSNKVPVDTRAATVSGMKTLLRSNCSFCWCLCQSPEV